MDTEKRGCLYLCPTPIGNLGDITVRSIEILRDVDIIAAEDTRNTLKLLNHFDIHTSLTSYHEHNKYKKAQELIQLMLSGKSIACVTDAGTPAISDPGEILVKQAIDSGIDVISLPGATAFVTALTVSGFSAERFVFEGFLPKAKKDRSRLLAEISNEGRTIILYEAPHHEIAICRELTKIHEEVLRLSLTEAVSYYRNNDPKGEFVLIIAGKPKEEQEKIRQKEYEDMTIAEHVEMYEALGEDRKEAMKKTAADRGISKREVYKALLSGAGYTR